MLLFFSVILAILVLLSLVVYTSELKLSIENLEVVNFKNIINPKYKVRIGLYFLGKIKIISKKIKYNKDSKYLKQNNINTQKTKVILNMIRKNLTIEKFVFEMYVDTENVQVTSYLVGGVSAILPNIISGKIKKYKPNLYKLKILPIYKNQNYIYIKLNSIISIKLVHIINMFKLIGGIKNERQSN